MIKSSAKMIKRYMRRHSYRRVSCYRNRTNIRGGALLAIGGSAAEWRAAGIYDCKNTLYIPVVGNSPQGKQGSLFYVSAQAIA
jgi:hypothetical protein